MFFDFIYGNFEFFICGRGILLWQCWVWGADFLSVVFCSPEDVFGHLCFAIFSPLFALGLFCWSWGFSCVGVSPTVLGVYLMVVICRGARAFPKALPGLVLAWGMLGQDAEWQGPCLTQEQCLRASFWWLVGQRVVEDTWNKRKLNGMRFPMHLGARVGKLNISWGFCLLLRSWWLNLQSRVLPGDC